MRAPPWPLDSLPIAARCAPELPQRGRALTVSENGRKSRGTALSAPPPFRKRHYFELAPICEVSLLQPQPLAGAWLSRAVSSVSQGMPMREFVGERSHLLVVAGFLVSLAFLGLGTSGCFGTEAGEGRPA